MTQTDYKTVVEYLKKHLSLSSVSVMLSIRVKVVRS